MSSFKPAFSLSSFTFIKRLFSSSLLSVVSSVYLRLLIVLLAILIPACASSSLACHMMYSAYKLNKQCDNIHCLDVLLPLFGTRLLFHRCSNCCLLTCIQVSQEAGKVVWYSHLLKNFPQFVVIPVSLTVYKSLVFIHFWACYPPVFSSITHWIKYNPI